MIELDKKTVQAAAYLANINMSDEVWQKMVEEPILFPTELMEEQKKELVMAMAALGLTLQKQEETK